MSELLVGLASFSMLFLSCFQVVNIMRNRHFLAAATSFAQGLAALTLYRYVPNIDTGSIAVFFLVGGVMGGQVSMYITRKHRAANEH